MKLYLDDYPTWSADAHARMLRVVPGRDGYSARDAQDRVLGWYDFRYFEGQLFASIDELEATRRQENEG